MAQTFFVQGKIEAQVHWSHCGCDGQYHEIGVQLLVEAETPEEASAIALLHAKSVTTSAYWRSVSINKTTLE
jgi:hypothetical protein